MDFTCWGHRELLVLATTFEAELIEAYVELGMPRGDAQGRVEAIIMNVN